MILILVKSNKNLKPTLDGFLMFKKLLTLMVLIFVSILNSSYQMDKSMLVVGADPKQMVQV